MMETLHTEDLAQIVRTGKFVIEFYGNGCLNCQMMAPLLSNLEQILPDIHFYRINADDYPALVRKYQLNSLPSLLLFRNGKMLSTIVGIKQLLTLQKLIETKLNA